MTTRDTIKALAGQESLRPARQALVVTLVLISVAAAMHTVNSIAIDGRALTFFSEHSIPSLMSGALFLVAAGYALVAAGSDQDRLVWGLIAAVMLLFTLEDLAFDLHNRIAEAGPKRVVLGLQVAGALALGAILWRLVLDLAWPIPHLLIASATALVISQTAELAANFTKDIGKPRNLLVLTEECSEMLVGGLVIAAAVTAIAITGRRSPVHGG